jgi:hypothetical protein
MNGVTERNAYVFLWARAQPMLAPVAGWMEISRNGVGGSPQKKYAMLTYSGVDVSFPYA